MLKYVLCEWPNRNRTTVLYTVMHSIVTSRIWVD